MPCNFTDISYEDEYKNRDTIHSNYLCARNMLIKNSNFRKWLHQNDQKLHQEFEKYLDGNRYHFCHKAKRWIDFMARKNNFRLDSNWPGRWLFGIYFIFWSRRDIASSQFFQVIIQAMLPSSKSQIFKNMLDIFWVAGNMTEIIYPKNVGAHVAIDTQENCKKSKFWEPFWRYHLKSTVNPTHLPQNWAKLAELAVLFSW